MAKSSEKVAGDKQPESQRGKSRFGVQPRSSRVVLPERPPREIDNEIVSILLGGDPTSLAAQIPEEPSSLNAAIPPPSPKVESATFTQARRQDEQPSVSKAADILRQVETVPPSSETRQTRAKDSQAKISPVLEVPAESSPSKVESVSSVPNRGVLGQNASPPLSNAGRSLNTTAKNFQTQDLAISSFEEFVERWKHGLRKGQLKVCEVLYQKTYALGETECVTSFSELGRLSGLKMRQCFNVIAQLEALKFVERAKSETTSNKKDQGSIIRFYLFPKN